MRIVSLVPSLTQTVCAIGLRENLVGCTSYCVVPSGLHRQATLVGGTKDPNVEIIASLSPTHIIVNTEENKAEHIQACRGFADVLETYPKGPEDVPEMLDAMASFLGASDAARMAEECRALLSELAVDEGSRPDHERFLYFIWRNPYMLVGQDTYISRVLELCGWSNAYKGDERYPSVTIDECAALDPTLIILSSEPYPFRIRDAKVLRKQWPRTSMPKICKADGQMWSWYGALTLEALKEVKAIRQGKTLASLE